MSIRIRALSFATAFFCGTSLFADQPPAETQATVSPHLAVAAPAGNVPVGDPWLDTKLIGGFPATMPVVPTRRRQPAPASWWQQELIGGFPAMLPVVPARHPRPLDGPAGIKAFIQDIR